MPRMNIKRTCKNRFLRCPTSENHFVGLAPRRGESQMSKIGVGHATFGYGRSRNTCGPLTKISGELVWTMDRSPTEYGGPGRVAHTLASAPNAVRNATHY